MAPKKAAEARNRTQPCAETGEQAGALCRSVKGCRRLEARLAQAKADAIKNLGAVAIEASWPTVRLARLASTFVM